MRFLLTNDDGYDAPGLAALYRVMARLGEVVELAPWEPQSGISHQVSTHRPLTLRETQPTRWALDGTPVDCTRVGLTQLAPDTQWVIAGINQGANLGADVYISGTVAAAREACLLGRSAIAVSHYVLPGKPVDWSLAAGWAAAVIETLLERSLLPGRFWNINLPHLPAGSPQPEVVHCPQDVHPLPVDYLRDHNSLRYVGRYHDRPRAAGSDVDVCFGGRIAVSELGLT